MKRGKLGIALLSEGPEGSTFPLHAVQAGLGEEGPQKGWEDFLTRQCEYPVENQIIKLLLMLFPLPGKLLTIHPHLPKPDLESGRSPGEGHGNPLQYSCLGNPMDRGAWRATVHRVAKSRIQLSAAWQAVPYKSLARA